MTIEEWWGQWPEARSKSLWQKKDCHTAWQAAIKQERERCAKIAQDFSKHYPKETFIEPPPGKHGESVDACSARAIRHVCPVIADAIKEARDDV